MPNTTRPTARTLVLPRTATGDQDTDDQHVEVRRDPIDDGAIPSMTDAPDTPARAGTTRAATTPASTAGGDATSDGASTVGERGRLEYASAHNPVRLFSVPGFDETVVRFTNHHVRTHADDSARFTQDDFHETRVLVNLFRR